MFSPISQSLKAVYPGISVRSEYIDTPTAWPAVTIIETSNIVLRRTSTTRIENASTLLFEVNVFSNEAAVAKLQAREIMGTVDAEFARLGFTRIMMSPTPNLADATIYRITARYEGVVVPEVEADGTVVDRIYTR